MNMIINEASIIYSSALGLLARREHSAVELSQKLSQRFPMAVADIQEVISRLQQEGYQSDSRFAEAYISSRMRKGFGSARIAKELVHKGVAKDTVVDLIAECKCQASNDQMLRVWQKKFGQIPQTAEEKYKQIQFLRYRGFDSEDIEQLYQQVKLADKVNDE